MQTAELVAAPLPLHGSGTVGIRGCVCPCANSSSRCCTVGGALSPASGSCDQLSLDFVPVWARRLCRHPDKDYFRRHPWSSSASALSSSVAPSAGGGGGVAVDGGRGAGAAPAPAGPSAAAVLLSNSVMSGSGVGSGQPSRDSHGTCNCRPCCNGLCVGLHGGQ